ncbi:MAG: electron transfer flavoprotein subunit beta [Firmicutes bacterium HGW-Firmicutes-12]|nr:MAG: electron transfer flavoprotein subunit beta [Firmicutes bacterium HGW-Firmicutes-12]
MEILVCIKQVPDPTVEVRIDPKTKNLVREGIVGVINPYDKNALEEAIRIKESQGGKVTVISMGPPQVKESLREALAMGADEAILLSDREFGGADTLATSYVLAQAIKKLGKVDIILFGKNAVDADTGQVGPIVAEKLGLPQITFASKISVDGNILLVDRHLEEATETIKVTLPAVITACKELNEPRYPNPLKIMKAARKEITVWGKTDIQVDAAKLGLKGSPTCVLEIFSPSKSTQVKILNGSPEEASQALFTVLREDKVI